MRQLSNGIKVVDVLASAAGTATRTSTVVDAAGFDGVLFVVRFTAIEPSAATTITAQHSDAVTDNDTLDTGADIEGSEITVADDDDGKLFVLDVSRPLMRYLQLSVNKDESNESTESALAILYHADAMPTTHGTGDGVGEGVASSDVSALTLVSPASGTP